PSPAPAQEAADLGSLRITTTPSGAQIFLNDADTGLTTPTSIQKIPLGKEYEVRIVKNQYKEFKKKFAPITTEPIIINEALAPLPLGVIDISSSPEGAKIILNGRDTRKTTPARIDNLEVPKDYQIKLSVEGHADWHGGVQVKDLEPVRLIATLTSLPSAQPSAPQQPAQTPAESAAKPAATVHEKKKPVKGEEKPPATASIGGKGTLKLDSAPSGADVYVNSEFHLKTRFSKVLFHAGS
ncbi:MAG: PEGA domain-containing protein, partial [Deltaproteobacteria bacterium]|nr:PEGA domain-containing protein [Deltaproteobacteria bacterium]